MRIEPDIKERAEAIAAGERRSISSWVGGLIADKVAAAEAARPPARSRKPREPREPITAGSSR